MARDESLIKAIEDAGHVPEGFKERHPGAHLCPDWDFMLIWDGCPEMGGCLCGMANGGHNGNSI